MAHTYIGEPDVLAWSRVTNTLRSFFLRKDFTEVHTQDRLSILAACEDPTTVATFEYAGERWPLPQTGQMWLEYELLTRPRVPGVFCVSTSFRQEKNPVPGRHRILFPMCEFESRGTIDDLRALEVELLEHLGYGTRASFPHLTYDEAARGFGTKELTSEHEEELCKTIGRAVFLEYFPEHTSPFWNMRRTDDGHAKKIDVLLDGMETIGSAERSSDADEMRRAFYTISDGAYATRLFDLFGQRRVERELEEFLVLPFVPRYGGGIGMTRLIRSLKLAARATA